MEGERPSHKRKERKKKKGEKKYWMRETRGEKMRNSIFAKEDQGKRKKKRKKGEGVAETECENGTKTS